MLHWDELKRLPVPPRVLTGYVAGLGAASVAFWLVPAVCLSIIDLIFHSASPDNSPVSPALWLLIAVLGTFVSLVIIFPSALLITFIPFCLVYTASVLFRIRSVLYFMLSGAVTGFLIPTAFQGGVLTTRDIWAPGQWAAMSVCGAVGGLVYWWIAVHRSPDEPAAEAP